MSHRLRTLGVVVTLGILTVTACATSGDGDGWLGTGRSGMMAAGPPAVDVAVVVDGVDPVVDAGVITDASSQLMADPPFVEPTDADVLLTYDPVEDAGPPDDFGLSCAAPVGAGGPDAGDGGPVWDWHCGGCCADATRWVNACSNAISPRLPGLGLALEIDCSKLDGGGVPIPPVPKYDKEWAIIVDQLSRCALPPVATTPEDKAKCIAAQEASGRPGSGSFGHAVAITCKKFNDDYHCVVIDRFSNPPRLSPVFTVKGMNKIPVTETDGKIKTYVWGPQAPSIETLEAMFPGCTVKRPGDGLKASGGVYMGPHPVSCIAPAPPSPFPVPAPDAGPKPGVCFYYCRESDPNYWEYSSFSDCKANRCDLKGKSSAGTCVYPSNIIGECTPP